MTAALPFFRQCGFMLAAELQNFEKFVKSVDLA